MSEEAKGLFMQANTALRDIVSQARAAQLSNADRGEWTLAKFAKARDYYNKLKDKLKSHTLTEEEAKKLVEVVSSLELDLKKALAKGKEEEEEEEEEPSASASDQEEAERIEKDTYLVNKKEAGTLLAQWRKHQSTWAEARRLGAHAKQACLDYQKAAMEIKKMFSQVDNQDDQTKLDISLQVAHVEYLKQLYDEYKDKKRLASKRKKEQEEQEKEEEAPAKKPAVIDSRSKCENCDQYRVLVEDEDGEFHMCQQCFFQECARKVHEVMESRFDLLKPKEQEEHMPTWNNFIDFVQEVINEDPKIKYNDALGTKIDEWAQLLHEMLPEPDPEYNSQEASDEDEDDEDEEEEYGSQSMDIDDDDDDKKRVSTADIIEPRLQRLEEAVFGSASYFRIKRSHQEQGDTLIGERYSKLKKARVARAQHDEQETDPEASSTILFITEIKD